MVYRYTPYSTPYSVGPYRRQQAGYCRKSAPISERYLHLAC